MTKKEWDTIKHFTPQEKWGDPDAMDYTLIWALDKLREKIGMPFIVHCGYETKGHAPKSFHKLGQAVDFHVKGIGLYTVWEEMDKMWWLGGLGIYPYWNNPGFHLDLGPCRRWHKNTKGDYFPIVNGVFLEKEV